MNTTARVCATVLRAESAHGNYTVRYDHADPSGVNGWECSCPDFKYRHRRCKHIEAADTARCNYGWEALAGGVGVVGDVCPSCGGEVISVEVRV